MLVIFLALLMLLGCASRGNSQGRVEYNQVLLTEGMVPSNEKLLVTDDEGDVLIKAGWSAGATDFGVIVVADDSAPTSATTISGPSVTTRSVVLRNLGATGALHLEETGGGTDTVQIIGPVSTAGGLRFRWPGVDGTAGQCLATNASGVLSWAACSGGTGSAAGSSGDVQFSADGAGTFGADTAFNWNNTDKRLLLGTTPPTTETLNIGGSIGLNNNNYIGFEDGGGTVRAVLTSTAGNVFVGQGVAPSAGGDLYLQSVVSTTDIALRLQARGDNVAVLQPQHAADGASSSRYFLGDNNRPFEAYIGLGANLIGFGGAPAQLLIEEQAATSGGGVGDFITILGGASMASGYTIGLPDDTPAIGDALRVASLDGSIWNLEWAPGGGGTGCVPTGGAGEIQFSNGAGACLNDSNLVWDNSSKELTIGGVTPASRLHVTDNSGTDTNIAWLQYKGSIGDKGSLVFANNASATRARIAAHTSSGSTVDLAFETFLTSATREVFRVTAAGDLHMTQNNTGIWMADSASTLRRQLWTDGTGTFHVGPAWQNYTTGGDVVLWATGATSEIGIHFDWQSTNVGRFMPFSGDSISLGGTSGGGTRFDWAYIQGRVDIRSGGGEPATILLSDENASGNVVGILGPPGTMGTTWAMRLPATGPTTTGQTLVTSSTSGGAWNLSWSGSGGSACGVAGNVQYSGGSGLFDCESNLSYNEGANELSVGGRVDAIELEGDRIRMEELAGLGSDIVTIEAPSMAGSYTLTLPPTNPLTVAPLTCPAGQAIKSLSIFEGWVITATCGVP